jgi:uncharacterized membrane protein YfcA
LALGGQRLMPMDLAGASAAAVLPAIIGMQAGLAVRRRLSEAAFRRALFIALLLLGGYIAIRSGLRVLALPLAD